MRALFAKLERIATTSETVLLIGESGTGKELLARAIHDASERRDAPFVIFDCGAVAPALVESELFGHVRGAFTGAQSDRRGVFSEAGSGTLVLDEIGELPLDLQPKLLRALESRQFRALGSNRVETVGARVVGGTHRDLKQMVQANTFRADLYFRLAVFEARVPPLRERRDDIELLADRLLTTLTPPRTLRELGTGVAAMLLAHDWPGNVRELRNTLMRLALFPELGARAFENVAQGPSGLDTLMHLPLRDAREEAITQFERHYLRAKLAENDGNVAQTAEAIGVSRQLVYRLIERHGLG
jgi:transcriptional regulator with PAS, ATPase and Fis domain